MFTFPACYLHHRILRYLCTIITSHEISAHLASYTRLSRAVNRTKKIRNFRPHSTGGILLHSGQHSQQQVIPPHGPNVTRATLHFTTQNSIIQYQRSWKTSAACASHMHTTSTCSTLLAQQHFYLCKCPCDAGISSGHQALLTPI